MRHPRLSKCPSSTSRREPSPPPLPDLAARHPLLSVTAVAHHAPRLSTSCRDSRQKLDSLLRSWTEWHTAKYLPGYVPPETVSGELAYHPETMHLAWEEKPAAPTVALKDQMWFNVRGGRRCSWLPGNM